MHPNTTMTQFVLPGPKNANDWVDGAGGRHSSIDDDTDMMMDVVVYDVEELSATSNQEATKVFEQWLSDNDHVGISTVTTTTSATTSSSSTYSHSGSSSLHSEDELAIMEIDEQIGSNLLRDDVFGGGCGGGGFGDSHDSSYSSTDPFGDFCETNSLFPPMVEVQSYSGSGEMVDSFLQIPLPAATLATPPPGPPSLLMEDAKYQEVLKKLEASMKRSQETRKSLTMKTDKTAKYGRTKSVSGVLSSIETSSRRLQTYLHHATHCAHAA
jgi:hypothetical protein